MKQQMSFMNSDIQFLYYVTNPFKQLMYESCLSYAKTVDHAIDISGYGALNLQRCSVLLTEKEKLTHRLSKFLSSEIGL